MKARKRFGQHFLADASIIDALVAVIRPRPTDNLLEIGPGHGALTRRLYGTTKRFTAIEIDRDLIEGLRGRYPDLELVNMDILNAPLETILAPGKWRLAGNLPYNISSPLLIKLFRHLASIEDMHFMFQRELAARLSAVPGTKDWGRLSVVTQYHCNVEALFEVAPEAFQPPPKVFSQVVRLTPLASVQDVDFRQLNDVLRMAFSARRKRVGNALKLLNLDWDQLGVAQSLRPDQLDVEQYVAITRASTPAAMPRES